MLCIMINFHLKKHGIRNNSLFGTVNNLGLTQNLLHSPLFHESIKQFNKSKNTNIFIPLSFSIT